MPKKKNQTLLITQTPEGVNFHYGCCHVQTLPWNDPHFETYLRANVKDITSQIRAIQKEKFTGMELKADGVVVKPEQIS